MPDEWDSELEGRAGRDAVLMLAPVIAAPVLLVIFWLFG